MAKQAQGEEEPDYAALGASVRLKALRAEIDRILERFPQLADNEPKPKRKPRSFTPAQRKEAAERMRKLWAKRKREKAAD